MQSKLNLLFPVEIINRELDFRLFQACFSARENNRIWIGRPRVLYSLANAMRGGLYMGKNIFGLPPIVTLHRYQNLKQRDFKFIQLDEEGAVYYGEEENWKRELLWRFNPTCLESEDYICAWGDFQREYYQSFGPACRDNIRTTGHPRFDMYKAGLREYFRPEAEKLRERYGDFLLINCNFALVNHHKGSERTFSPRMGYEVGEAENRLFYFQKWRHITHTLTNFMRLINRLSLEFPDLNIVVRPHPSENKEFYQHAFGGVSNIHVSREGGVSAWLLACKAMIHDGCTTGLEAHFADVPIINYKSVVDKSYDLYLPNVFGARCENDEQVMEQIHALLRARERGGEYSKQIEELPQCARDLLDNFQHDAFAKLDSVIQEVSSSIAPEKWDYHPARYAVTETLRGYEQQVKAAARRSLQPRRTRREALDKFYGFDNTPLDARFERVQEVTGRRVQFKVHSPDLLSAEGF